MSGLGCNRHSCGDERFQSAHESKLGLFEFLFLVRATSRTRLRARDHYTFNYVTSLTSTVRTHPDEGPLYIRAHLELKWVLTLALLYKVGRRVGLAI
jgi:hypothetical protein